jgi:hypothetical protein
MKCYNKQASFAIPKLMKLDVVHHFDKLQIGMSVSYSNVNLCKQQ